MRSGSPNYSGKTFEKQFKASLEAAGAFVVRLPDSTFILPGGGTGSAPSLFDFIVLDEEEAALHSVAVECKAVSGMSIPFERVKEHQVKNLKKIEDYSEFFCHGAVAVNYYNSMDVKLMNRLFMIPIDTWTRLVETLGRKSLPVATCETEEDIIECPRVAGSIWDMRPYLERL